MKISIKWILVLTLILCFHLSLSGGAILILIGLSGLSMALLLPAVAYCKWSIADEDGWWRFQGSKFARMVVWGYAIAFLNIALGVVRLVIIYPADF